MSNQRKREQSAKLAADVEEFLANGGAIHQATFEDTQMAREKAKRARKRTTTGAPKFTTNPERLGDGGEAMKADMRRELDAREARS